MFGHPSDVCMTYIEHAKFSLYISAQLAIGAVKAFIHAACPDIFVTSTSDLIDLLRYTLAEAGCR